MRRSIRNLLRRPDSKQQPQKSRKRRWMGLENLETRRLMVVNPLAPVPVPSGFTTPAIVGQPGVALDGVVQINSSSGSGSGSLLWTGRHILTAAHVITSEGSTTPDAASYTVRFEVPGRADQFYTVPSSQITIHPGWNGDIRDGNDIAVMQLDGLAPSGIAGSTRYDIYDESYEVSQRTIFSGYGRTGSGDSGAVESGGNLKRWGHNIIDAVTGENDILETLLGIDSTTSLLYDFDSGLEFHNTLWLVDGGSSPAALPLGDSMTGKGDSGGPNFVYEIDAGQWKIGGVTSGAFTYTDFTPDSDFGDIAMLERVSAHAGWIRAVTSGPYELVIDATRHFYGQDGIRDNIELRRVGQDIQVWVAGSLLHQDQANLIYQIRVLGSIDGETVTVAPDLAVSVDIVGNGGFDEVVLGNGATSRINIAGAEIRSKMTDGFQTETRIKYASDIDQIKIMGDSSDIVDVAGTSRNGNVILVNPGTVLVNNVSRGTIQSDIGIATFTGLTNLQLYSGDSSPSVTYDVYADKVQFGARAVKFSEDSLSSLTLQGGDAADTFNVRSTPHIPFDVRNQESAKLTINTGRGADQVRINKTTIPVRVNDGGGADQIAIGSVSTSGVEQSVHIVGGSDRLTKITVNDYLSTQSRSIGLDITGGTARVTGYTPTYAVNAGRFQLPTVTTAISYNNNTIAALNLTGGSRGNTFDVYDTTSGVTSFGKGSLTSIWTGGGTDQVTVHGSTGRLAINLQSGLSDSVTVGSPSRGLDRVRGNISLTSDPASIAPSLLVDDRLGSQSRTLTTDSNALKLSASNAITFDGLYSFNVLGGIWGNNFVVENTPILQSSLGQIGLYTGAGSDSVLIKRTSQDLLVDGQAGLQHRVTIGTATTTLDDIGRTIRIADGQSVGRSLTIDDQANTQTREVELGRSGVDWWGLGTIDLGGRWDNATLSYVGGSGDDLITFSGRPQTQTVINPGAGNDYVFVTSPEGMLHDLGTVRVSDSSGIDTLFISDAAGTQDRIYTLGQTTFPTVSTDGTQVMYQGIDLLAVTAGSGDNTFTLQQMPKELVVELIGGDGVETFIGPDVNAQWQIVGADGRHALVDPSVPNAGVAFSRIENIQAGSGDDQFLFASDAVPIAGDIDGGNGNNTLDYSSFSENVYVNLSAAMATQVDGLVASFTTVLGGTGNDILVGSGGNVLVGGGGRDLLIAGASASQLFGGSDEDLLLGGTTQWDNSEADLRSILAFWSRNDLDYSQRVDALFGGLEVPKLDAESVIGNGGNNLLWGQSETDELDLYFATFESDTLDADENIGDIVVRL